MNDQAASSATITQKGSSQSRVDSANTEFWSELCGSSLASMLGIVDASAESLAKFDNWYFDFYPYLLPFVAPDACKGKRLLEIGLGYGSLSQALSQAGAVFTGLDISPGPVGMVNHRLSQLHLPGKAVRASVLDCPFADKSFDVIVAIGSLHHTGSLVRALQELSRIAVPGARLVFMVYNALSYRRWVRWPVSTMRHALSTRGPSWSKPQSTESERRAYDADAAGNAAPETEFFARSELRRMLGGWSIEAMELKNVGDEGPLRSAPRPFKLRTIGPWAGLDIYVRATRK